MGQTLSEPVTTKETTICQSAEYNVASSAMQGWRVAMEDSHTHLLALPDDEQAAFFAVYDGHGGARVAQYAGMHLHKRVVNNDLYGKGDYPGALKHAFLRLDEDLRQDEETKEQMSGTTAVTVLIKNNVVYCANSGDSRAVICDQGKAVPLSFDHKPTNSSEMQRIVAAGGWVDSGRVNSNLALSRALGDFIYKSNDTLKPEDQIVTANPDVIQVELTKDHEFIVLACDGVWDVMSNEQVVGFCRQKLADGLTPEQVCEEIMDRCLAPDCELSGVGCDNMTFLLVCLLQGDTPDEYARRIKSKPVVYEGDWGMSYNSVGVVDVEMEMEIREVVSRAKMESALAARQSEDESTSPTNYDNALETLSGTEDDHSDSKKEDFITPAESPNFKTAEESSEDDSPPTEFEVVRDKQPEEQKEQEKKTEETKPEATTSEAPAEPITEPANKL